MILLLGVAKKQGKAVSVNHLTEFYNKEAL